MNAKTIESMTFHVAPRDQGQIVEVAYAATEDGRVIRCRYDRSDGTTEYHVSTMLRDDKGDYWDAPPANRRWRLLSAKERRVLDL